MKTIQELFTIDEIKFLLEFLAKRKDQDSDAAASIKISDTDETEINITKEVAQELSDRIGKMQVMITVIEDEDGPQSKDATEVRKSLSKICEVSNERYGKQFTKAKKLYTQSIREAV